MEPSPRLRHQRDNNPVAKFAEPITFAAFFKTILNLLASFYFSPVQRLGKHRKRAGKNNKSPTNAAANMINSNRPKRTAGMKSQKA